VSLCRRWLKLQRLLGLSHCIVERRCEVLISIIAHPDPNMSETDVRSSERRVSRNGVFQQSDCISQILFRTLMGELHCADVDRVRLDVICVCISGTDEDPCHQRGRHLRSYIALDCEDIVYITIVILSPKMVVRVRVNQLNSDSDTIAGLSY